MHLEDYESLSQDYLLLAVYRLEVKLAAMRLLQATNEHIEREHERDIQHWTIQQLELCGRMDREAMIND